MKVSRLCPKLMMLSKTSLLLLLTVFFFSFLFSLSPVSAALNVGTTNDGSVQTTAVNIPKTACQSCLGCNFSGVYVNDTTYWAGYTPTTYFYTYVDPYNYWNYTFGMIHQDNLSAPVGIGTKTPAGLLEIKDAATTTVVISSGAGNSNATLEFREVDVPRASIEYVGLTGLLNFWSKYADSSLDVMMSMNTRTNEVHVLGNLSVGDRALAPNICYSNGSNCNNTNITDFISENYVPYTGATANVNLSPYNLETTGNLTSDEIFTTDIEVIGGDVVIKASDAPGSQYATYNENGIIVGATAPIFTISSTSFTDGEILIDTKWLNISGSVNIDNNLTVLGNVTASYFHGDGSQLTGIQQGNLILYFLAKNSTCSYCKNNLSLSSIANNTEVTLTGAGLPDGISSFGDWITDPGVPNLELIEGSLRVHVAGLKSAGTKNAQFYYEVYKTNATGGNEVLLGTSEYTPSLTAIRTNYRIWVNLLETDMNLTDRIRVKGYALVSGIGSAPTVSAYIQGASQTRLEIPVGAVSVEKFVPYLGALYNLVSTKNITANWLFGNLNWNYITNFTNLNMGGNNITNVSYTYYQNLTGTSGWRTYVNGSNALITEYVS